MNQADLIPHLFRTEYSKLVAVLCKGFGLAQIEIAEDIVSDTFLLAAETWGKKGIPDNQVGWLYTVAKNRTRDHIRRHKVRIEKVEPAWKADQEASTEISIDLSEANIEDSQLRMLFAICHPSLKRESQIILALRILCGFGIPEIASALLSNKDTINKRLYRAKKSLRDNNVEISSANDIDIRLRLDTVLTSLYLLFNEGYYSSSTDHLLKKDLCLEAMRLTLLLLQHPSCQVPKVNALLSLMCFHASRFEARYSEDGVFNLYKDQDRRLWNQPLIDRGEYFLNQASTGEELSRYHLEAAIAFWHTQEDHPEKWEQILQLYNVLLQVDYSPIAALNRTYALSQANGAEEGLREALKLKLEQNHLYHSLLAELYQEIDTDKVIHHLQVAISLSTSDSEKALLSTKLAEAMR